MKIIFMGTPEFAAPSLKCLIESSHIVSAVFTQAPKPSGRGMMEKFSPVHQIAKEHEILVYNPKNLRSDEIRGLVEEINADIIIVVAYGFIIPKAILETTKYGCLNIHPSALPRFRGAAPLQRTIIAGDPETEICIMQMDEGLDTGDILLKQKLALHDKITLKELHDTCAHIGADLLLKVLDNIDNLQPIKQSEEGLVYANKLSKEEGIINWNDSAFSIDCKVRGMNPWPGVFFKHNDNMIRVLETEYQDIIHQFTPGTIIGEGLDIACGKGILSIKKLQRAGKAPISSNEFLRGYNLKGLLTTF